MYVIDTNALWKLDELRVDEASKERVWGNILDMAANGQLRIIDLTLDELRRHGRQACLDRLQPHIASDFVCKADDLLVDPYQVTLQRVITNFPAMAGANAAAPNDRGAPKRKADAYIVTLAAMDAYTVVTQEGQSSAQKIPNACRQFKVESIDVADLIIRERLDRER